MSPWSLSKFMPDGRKRKVPRMNYGTCNKNSMFPKTEKKKGRFGIQKTEHGPNFRTTATSSDAKGAFALSLHPPSLCFEANLANVSNGPHTFLGPVILRSHRATIPSRANKSILKAGILYIGLRSEA